MSVLTDVFLISGETVHLNRIELVKLLWMAVMIGNGLHFELLKVSSITDHIPKM